MTSYVVNVGGSIFGHVVCVIYRDNCAPSAVIFSLSRCSFIYVVAKVQAFY